MVTSLALCAICFAVGPPQVGKRDADEARPARLIRYSGHRDFAVLVVPSARWPKLKGDCRASLFELEEGKRRKRLWARNLVNERAPKQVFVADDGRHVVTIDEWGRGALNHAVAVYGSKGELVGLLRIDDLLDRSERRYVRRAEGSVDWATRAECGFSPDGRLFVIRCRWGAIKAIVLKTARLLDRQGDVPDGERPLLSMPRQWQAIDEASVPDQGEGESPEGGGGAGEDDASESGADDWLDGSQADAWLPIPDPFDPVDYVAWLNETYAVPPVENAAPLYEEAMEALTEPPDDDTVLYQAMRHLWDDADHQELAAWLEANARAMALFRAATLLPARRPGYHSEDGYMISILLPRLRDYRTVSKAFVADANRKAAGGDIDGAFDDLATVLRAGQHLADGATVIEHLVGLACKSLAYEALARMAAQVDADRAGAEVLFRQVLADDQPAPTPSRTILCEKAFYFDTVQHVFTGPLADGKPTIDPQEALKVYNWTVPEPVSELPVDIPPLDYDDVLAQGSRLYDQLVDAIHTPLHQATEKYEVFEDMLAETDPIVRAFIPALQRTHELNARTETMRRGASVLGAIQAYRRDTGAYPESLDDLPADVVGPVRVDELTGEDLIYRREGDGFVLYSLGEDGEDQGGVGKSSFREGHDYVFWPRR